jgi:hypothetical protein
MGVPRRGEGRGWEGSWRELDEVYGIYLIMAFYLLGNRFWLKRGASTTGLCQMLTSYK